MRTETPDAELWRRIRRLRRKGVSCTREDDRTVFSILAAVGDLTLHEVRRLVDLWEQDRQARLRAAQGGLPGPGGGARAS